MWNVLASREFAHWFASISEADREQITVVVELLRARGPQLGRPYADTLKGSKYSNMKELRITAGRRAIRIAFAFDPQRDAILLAAGDKRGISQPRFYRQLIAQADAIYTEHLRTR